MTATPTKCDCKTITKNGETKKAPPDKQPSVYLYPSFDPRYKVGTCRACKKVHTAPGK